MPLAAGMAIVSGLSGQHPVMRVEAAARAPYPLAGDLQLGRVWLSDAPQGVHFVRQDYDFSCGELHTTSTFEIQAHRAHFEVTRFCSRSHPVLVLQEIQLEVEHAGEIVLRSVIDPLGVLGRWLRRNTGTPGQAEAVVDGSLLWETLGALTTCGVAYACRRKTARHGGSSGVGESCCTALMRAGKRWQTRHSFISIAQFTHPQRRVRPSSGWPSGTTTTTTTGTSCGIWRSSRFRRCACCNRMPRGVSWSIDFNVARRRAATRSCTDGAVCSSRGRAA